MNLVWEWPDCPERPVRCEDTAVFFKMGEAYGRLSNMLNEYHTLTVLFQLKE